MENRARAQHYCVSLHLVEKKVKKETFEVKKKLEMGQLEVWSQ